MTGPNPEAFKRSLKRFCDSLPPKQSKEFSDCTIEDVKNAVRDLQQKQGAEGKLRYEGRLGAFIEAMDQFGKVLDLFVNANELVCFIWVRSLSAESVCFY